MKYLLLIFFGFLLLFPGSSVDAEPAYWKIDGEKGTLYVLGTMHRLPEDTKWFSDEMKAILESADALVLETENSKGASEYINYLARQDGLVLSNKHLAGEIGQESFRAYAAKMAGYGVKEETIARYRPWYAALLLTLLGGDEAGYFSEFGADTLLEKFAAKRGIRRLSLETTPQQILFFVELPDDTQIQYLETTLEYSEDFKGRFDEQFDAWFSGDTETTANLVLEPLQENELLYDTLILNRNKAWVEKFEYFLSEEKTYFIAVGTGHLVGPDSVLEMLEGKGYKITRQ